MLKEQEELEQNDPEEKCHYCASPVTRWYRPDIDLNGIPLCNNVECAAKLYLFLSELEE